MKTPPVALVLSPRASVFAPLLFAGNLAEGIAQATVLGFDGVEISMRDPAEVPMDEVAEQLGRRGLRLFAIGTGRSYYEDGLSLVDPDAERRTVLYHRLVELIHWAAQFGAAIIIGGVRGRTSPGQTREQVMELLEAGVSRLSSVAHAAGVPLLIEPVNRYETDLINTAAEALALVRAVGSPALGVLLDTFHMNIEEVSLAAALQEAGALLRHVHLVDSNRWAPGYGHIDLVEVRDTLLEIGYTGPLGLEVLPRPDDLTASREGLRRIREFFAQRRT